MAVATTSFPTPPATVLVSASFWQDYGSELARLLDSRLGVRVHPLPGQSEPPHNPPLDSVVCAFQSVDTFELPGFDQALETAPGLKWLHTCTAGADRPLLYRLQARGVTVTTSAGANARPVAHNAMAALLAIARRFPRFAHDQLACRWNRLTLQEAPVDLEDTTATIVGQGHIGREIARLCQAVGIRTIGVRRSNRPSEHCDSTVALADLASVLPHTDWLILACALTPETDGLIDLAKLRLLPRHAVVINVSRGRVVVEDDLIKALREGLIGHAYADVFHQEPLPADSPLWTLPNMMISPHSAGISRGFPRSTARAFLSNLDRWMQGAPLSNVAEPPAAA